MTACKYVVLPCGDTLMHFHAAKLQPSDGPSEQDTLPSKQYTATELTAVSQAVELIAHLITHQSDQQTLLAFNVSNCRHVLVCQESVGVYTKAHWYFA